MSPPAPPARGPRPGRARAPRAGAPRRPPPRSPCSCRRGAPRRRVRFELGAQQRQQLLERLAPPSVARHRHVVPVQPGRLVGGQVVPRAHHRTRPASPRARADSRSRPPAARRGGCVPHPPAARARTACAGAPTRFASASCTTASCDRESGCADEFAPGNLWHVMCRVFGCVAAEPASIRHELVEAENPLIRQSEEHDSGWGMAVYERADGLDPRCVRFPEAAFSDPDFIGATEMQGRIFNVHVRRATMGGLAPENTHPFCLGSYSFGHNGTILRYPRLLEHPACPAERRHRLRGLLQLPDDDLRRRRPDRLAAPRDPDDGRALAVQRPQLPLLRRRPPVRLPARAVRAALAAPARAAAGRLRARHRRAVAHRPAGRPAGAGPG